MAKKLELFFLLFLSLAALFSPTWSSIISNGIDRWCNKTPYPETCKYSWWRHINDHAHHHHQKLFVPKNKSDFKKLALQITIQEALKAESQNQRLGSKCRNNKEKAAWFDCLKLYEETILLLNQTLDSTTNCTDFDVQTWLSAALTNLETCSDGFVELGVKDFILPLMSNNVSKLISNTLAIKNGSIPAVTNGYNKEGFPSWLLLGDRKLLQLSSSLWPNLVVAQDGSGDYKTIKAALDAAGKRSGSGRFVIHVKRGVYKENLEIGNELKNIMLVGDGMRYTIISGSRSVGGGFTTFSSATVGK